MEKNQNKKLIKPHFGKNDDSVKKAPAYCQSFLDGLLVFCNVLWGFVKFCNLLVIFGGQTDGQTDQQPELKNLIEKIIDLVKFLKEIIERLIAYNENKIKLL